jgi:hypothetical protein
MDQRNVQVARAQGACDPCRVDLQHHGFQARVLMNEGGQRREDYRSGGGGESADPQGARQAATSVDQVCGGLFQAFEDGLCMVDQFLSCRGEGDPPPRSLQKGHTCFAFEGAELLGDR